MHHRRRSLLSAIRWTHPAILAMLLGCEGAGHLVVMLDGTASGPTTEVVAVATDGVFAGSTANLPRPLADSLARLRALEDSAATLARRFSASRDSINREVAALDSIDRRTRSYAVRYADVRRRTLAAEQVRARRDTARAHADTLRARLAPALAAARNSNGDDSIVRVPATAPVTTLRLAPGEWLVGTAAAGVQPSRLVRATVRAGHADTLRLTAPR